ncbi:MAG TPA: 5-dehydro-4-deoxyglucarate dehydratase, partial [Streptosporangiaceae bacterium]|nr:5-dehydro-4-deoxyglucarate dehydratase [Streptosporangiaceae bacterium]
MYPAAHEERPRAGLADRLRGLLFFPVSPFQPDERVNPDVFREHLRARLAAGPGAVFACCGTGEFFSLDPDDFAALVSTAVQEVGGRVPVVAGIGYGTTLARHFVHAAEQAGVDGLLVMPPYLVDGGQAGLRRHYDSLADSTGLDLILYQRDNAIFAPATVVALARRPNVIGFKDGYGDLDLLQRIIGAVRVSGLAAGFRFFNGLPTAEVTGLAYLAMGVSLYSSAVFCFAPDIAMEFHDALRRGDGARVNLLLDAFYQPFAELRRLRAGYSVSLVKASVRAQGLDVGPVRPPLTEPEEDHVKQVAALVEQARRLLADQPPGPVTG